MAMCFFIRGLAQKTTGTFYSVVGYSNNYLVETFDEEERQLLDCPQMDEDSIPCNKQPKSENEYERLSIEEIEHLIAYYEQRIMLRDSIMTNKNIDNETTIRSCQQWNPRELTLNNLKSVLGEVGLSNKLFVLAQAVLETGNFSSRVCKEYNNLFGLYDSKNRDYYRFARWEDSVIGYKRMIQYRYKGGNYLQFLKRIGYAEDPRYIPKVAQIARRIYKEMF